MTHPMRSQSRDHQTKATRRTRFWHLIVHSSQRWRHLVRQGTGDDHDVRLSRRGSEDDAQSVLVVASGGHVCGCISMCLSRSDKVVRTHASSRQRSRPVCPPSAFRYRCRLVGQAHPKVMGQIEPCRAQLTTLSRLERTYSAVRRLSSIQLKHDRGARTAVVRYEQGVGIRTSVGLPVSVLNCRRLSCRRSRRGE